MSDSPSASFAGPAAPAFGGSFGAAAAGAGDSFAGAAAAGAGAGRRYGPGSYGYRRSEQARLGARYGQPVSGASHEAEHPLAAESVRQLRGAATRAEVEQPLPAYQEAREVHRLHAGTGTGRKLRADGSAFETGWSSAEQYRADQLTALRGGDVSTALQLQSLGIAFARQNAGLANTPYNRVRLAQAEDSYQHMLAHMGVGARRRAHSR
ncbi:hypothetical protein [Chitinimonas koreensis]|uniref:hypothetical protein n=1 Tax=Chitinimonas koreensis TaxID=356302 RepID=UPI0016542150|nr:hypothetical protein [Chitinimonas koreensis]QNM95333.1 hypothetical protein H9L41_15845 [Chitinimonas koreensis]